VVPLTARPYQGRPAGIATRSAAAIVDLLVVVAIVVTLYLAFGGVAFALHPTSFHWPHHLALSLPIVSFLVVVPYLTLTWCATGRSYGDALFGLRVVDRRGERMSLPGGALRAAFCVLFPFGLFWVVISRRNRSLQDLVLKTSAIYDWIPEPATTMGTVRVQD
jgi:uncharacterized RDD family membrane protein YckC